MLGIAQDMPTDVMHLMNSIAFPLDRVAGNCHAVSLAIVKSGIYPGARVARGRAKNVTSQHSWVVGDGGIWDWDSHVIDATLWSFDPTVPHIWQGTYRDNRHRPHGWGNFRDAALPESGGKAPVDLTPTTDLSLEATMFLHMIGPLDHVGWSKLAKLPVTGWPAREIIEAMLDTPGLRAMVPIDIAGMLTDRNPGGVYL